MMTRTARRARTMIVATAVAAAVALFGSGAQAQARTSPGQSATVDVRLIGINDFHGNLEPPAGSSGRVLLDDGKSTVNAGGAAYVAAHIKTLESQVKNSILLSAGDNIGASPLPSALFHDEPTIEFLNDIGLDASAVGNHEFDEGYRELLRIQFGGCNPTDGCQFRPRYSGAKFPYLGANVTFTNGRPAILPFTVKFEKGIPIGIIGATLQDLPSVVTPTAVAGLKFGDEVQAIDRTAGFLDRLGVKTLIVTMHQGDQSEGGGPQACNLQANGIAQKIATTVTPQVDAFFTGHSHQQYNCSVNDPAGNPRPVIQGLSFGRLLSVIDIKIDKKTRDVVRSATVANNVIVTRDIEPDPKVAKLVADAVAKSAPIANRPVGTITADITRTAPPSGEQPLGDVIADAQLAATIGNGAQIAITNPGGIRTDLNVASSTAGEGDGVVTYGEAFAVQPFANIMQTITMTGAQLDAVLEQQWQPTATRILQISQSLHYTQDLTQPVGSRVSNLTVNLTPVDPAAPYRVSVNNFLAAGGDGFTVFAQGTDITGGPIDIDAFTQYLSAHPSLAPPPADRILVTG